MSNIAIEDNRKMFARSDYIWVNVVIASIAMTATLPGRTHGLGLITEPLLADLGITPTTFANLNFCAALIGALFCIPVGRWIDHSGVRVALTFVTLGLGLSVLAMCRVQTWLSLGVTLTLVRGFGQSALSLVSLSVISKHLRNRLGIAMAAFAVLLTFGFIGSVLGMGHLIESMQWRSAWSYLGWILIALAPFFWVFGPSSLASIEKDGGDDSFEMQVTLAQAIRSPIFWLLIACSSMFNLVWSGVTLFNESIMRERGLDANDSAQIMAILAGVGLLANMLAGPFATPRRMLPLTGFAMLILAAGLFWCNRIDSLSDASIYSVALGSSGGIITVVFFAAWRLFFGKAHLGRIQSCAQIATVFASAVGPVVFATAKDRFEDYELLFYGLSIACIGLALTSFIGGIYIKPAANKMWTST